MAVELHLPDLPEVPLSLGPAAGAALERRQPWMLRLRDALSSYLPLLMMALLALGTWWLVKHTPPPPAAPAASAVRREPDYTMTQFAVERFDRSGRLRVRVDGERMRHYPDTGRYEVDEARIRAIGSDGSVTVATARRALANADLSELQLHGGAQVVHQSPRLAEVQIRSEFLHAFLVTERVRTHLPVQVNEGSNRFEAAGLEYDHPRRLLELKGRQRAHYEPAAKALP
ncbi:MAG: LPS export ABC transporter periplasmic protein LptC [Rubrivivax sp.]